MGIIDRFYYGQGKLIVNAPSGAKVVVKEGSKTWESTGNSSFMLPGTKRYIVTCGSNEQAVELSFGACKSITF